MQRMEPRYSHKSQACTSCHSAEMSFTSSTDDNRTNELHLIKSSMSSSGMIEGTTVHETSSNNDQKSMAIPSGSLLTTTIAFVPPGHEHLMSSAESDSHTRKQGRLKTLGTHVGMGPEPFNFFQPQLLSKYPRVLASQARLDSTSSQVP